MTWQITLNDIRMTVLIASLDVGWDIPVLITATVAGGLPTSSDNVATYLCVLTEFLGHLAAVRIQLAVICLTELKQPDLSSNGCKPGHQCAHHSALGIRVIGVLLDCYCVLLSDEMKKRFHYGRKRTVLPVMVLWYITSVPVMKAALGAQLLSTFTSLWTQKMIM